jgi:Phage terminase large subunit
VLTFQGVHADIIADETPELDVEGARMSAKTWTISEKLRLSCLKHPGIWWLMSRYSGTETDNQLRPQFIQVCRKQGTEPEWNNDESAYWFPEKDGKVSKVFAFGLRTQSKDQRYAKIRGSGFAGVWIDQAEEVPEDIGTEVRALVRQPGFPHQLIFSPNPPNEEHFLADQFPEDIDLPGRKYYRLSLYDNRHNLDRGTIEKMEMAYPITHAKHRSLILGLRGPSISGNPVYEHAFLRPLHVAPVQLDTDAPLLEAVHFGQKHPVWVAGQRTYFGGLNVLGGIIGKKMFLDDFLPIVQRYRQEWFRTAKGVETCCDPPPSKGAEDVRFSNIAILKEFGFKPTWTPNSTAPDSREAIIQSIGGMMKRRHGAHQAFLINSDPSRFLMASTAVVKQSKLMVDSLEASYVWDDVLVSVSNKKVRQPRQDDLIEGSMRCLENIVSNFCALKITDAEKEQRELDERQREATNRRPELYSPHNWLSY